MGSNVETALRHREGRQACLLQRHDRQPICEERKAMSDSDEPDPPPIVVKFPSPQTLPPHPMSERGARPLAPPPAEQSEPPPGLITPLPRPEPPPAMQTPPPPPMNRDGVVVDHATSGECHLCGKPSGEKMLLVSYRATPLIGVRVAICLHCMRDLALTELDRRRKHTENARRAEYEAEDRKYGFGKRERRELELSGFFSPRSQKVSREFIDAAVRLAGLLRNDWYGGGARLSLKTERALADLLEALGKPLR
jgi:hypothetical protein